MKLAAFAAIALAAAAPPSSPPAETFAPAVQPGRIVQLVGTCRRLSIIAYRTADSTALDNHLADLLRNYPASRDELIACGAYIIGSADAGFYLPDPE